MLTPYGLDIIESCLACKMRAEHIFCDLPPTALQAFESIKYATAYPKGAVLFVEGQRPRGIFVLCKGRVKLSMCSPDGKTLIVRIAKLGEVLGLSATVSGKPYELTAETMSPRQVNFVKREDFLRFLKGESDACFRVAEQLGDKYNSACRDLRAMVLSHSAAEKLADSAIKGLDAADPQQGSTEGDGQHSVADLRSGHVSSRSQGTMHGPYSQELGKGPEPFYPEPEEARHIDFFECNSCETRFFLQDEGRQLTVQLAPPEW